MEPSKVVQALKMLQEEGREDLIKDGVLEQAWVGLRRPKRSSAEGVTAAILACTSPEQSPIKFEKFESKSVSGRKLSVSPECAMELVGESSVELPVGRPVRQGGVRFARWSGASFRQRVAAVGRGSLPVAAVLNAGQVGVFISGTHALKSQRAPYAAVSVVGRAGASSVGVHAFKRRHASKECSKQAPSAVESDAEWVELVLEEGTFEGAANMVAPLEGSEFLTVERGRQQPSGGQDRATCSNMDIVVIDSDDEGEDGKATDSEVGRRGASSRLDIGEESLDYDEEDPVHGVRSVATVEKSKTSRRAVQGDRLLCRHRELAGNLLRGEVSGYEAGMVGVGFGGNTVVAQGKDNVDVTIQVSVGAEAGKLEVSQGVADVVTGKLEVAQTFDVKWQKREVWPESELRFVGVGTANALVYSLVRLTSCVLVMWHLSHSEVLDDLHMLIYYKEYRSVCPALSGRVHPWAPDIL
ncbi:hypothetical protein NDU88_002481 [Pleurodeles waltl]|uniref:Uncharacterized protein n=1 Tax=Pleurodeles waltl TaxID=8319 RepID=A0AAV7UXG3_PLEWA|nr:hypothetical protein NDU88_002481 [Pleurodeles waltl]